MSRAASGTAAGLAAIWAIAVVYKAFRPCELLSSIHLVVRGGPDVRILAGGVLLAESGVGLLLTTPRRRLGGLAGAVLAAVLTGAWILRPELGHQGNCGCLPGISTIPGLHLPVLIGLVLAHLIVGLVPGARTEETAPRHGAAVVREGRLESKTAWR